MSSAVGSKAAHAALVDPLYAPEPSADTGLNSHFTSTFAPAQNAGRPTTGFSSPPPRNSLGSNNPFRDSQSATNKTPSPRHSPHASKSSSSPRGRIPDYRADAFGDYKSHPHQRTGSNPPSYAEASAPSSHNHRGHRRRTSSLNERYPGDESVHPLDMIRRDSRKADRSPHLKKHHQPRPDTIDRLDPAVGGHAYHHEGPFDAALLARNTSYENSPLAALKTSNEEALKATPEENIKDALERHRPLEGVANVPPGMTDRFGRTYQYEEGADLMHEDAPDGPGYKRWADKDYSPDDLKGQSEPTFSLDRALKAHNIDGDGIEMKERHARDPVDLAGGESKYVDMEIANAHDNDASVHRTGSLRAGLKKRLGSLRKKHREE